MKHETVMRAGSCIRAGEFAEIPSFEVVLAHDERHLRRRRLSLRRGGELLLDLAEPVALEHGDALVLEDGRLVAVIAEEEALYGVRGRDENHLMELCWHLGNRHLACQIDRPVGQPGRLLILRDHVIRDMLLRLGANVEEVRAAFVPVRGAYHGPAGGADPTHDHEHPHHHD